MRQKIPATLKSRLLNIVKIAKSNNWVIKYDALLDLFYWSLPKIPKGTKLWHLTDDLAFYVSPKGELRGLFIEYFKSNFLEHNEKLEELPTLLTKEVKDNILSIDQRKTKEAEHYLSDLEDLIKISTYEVAEQNK